MLKKAAKVVLIGAGLLLVLVGVVIVLSLLQAHTVWKPGLEKTLSHALQTEVTVESLTVSLLNHVVEVRGLVIPNPEGFREGPAMTFDRILIDYDPTSLLMGTMQVKQMTLEGTELHIRHELRDGINLRRLAKNAARLGEQPDADAPEGAGRRFVIRELRCEETDVDLSANMIPGASVSVTIEPFKLENVGSEDPVTTAELSVVVIRSLLRELLDLRGLAQPVVELLKPGAESEPAGATD